MKKIDAYIDYMKLVMVLILFLLGSLEPEPKIPVLVFLLSAFFVSAAAELFLLRARRIYAEKYDRYLKSLEKAVKEQLSHKDAA